MNSESVASPPAPNSVRFFPDIFLCDDRNIRIEVFESTDQRFLCSSGGEGGVLLYSLKKLFCVGVHYFEGNAVFGNPCCYSIHAHYSLSNLQFIDNGPTMSKELSGCGNFACAVW